MNSLTRIASLIEDKTLTWLPLVNAGEVGGGCGDVSWCLGRAEDHDGCKDAGSTHYRLVAAAARPDGTEMLQVLVSGWVPAPARRGAWRWMPMVEILVRGDDGEWAYDSVLSLGASKAETFRDIVWTFEGDELVKAIDTALWLIGSDRGEVTHYVTDLSEAELLAI